MNWRLKVSSIITGTGPLALAGVVSVRSMSTVIVRIACVIDMADERFGDHRNVAVLLLRGADDLPCDSGQMRGNAAEDFAVEELDDLGTALLPPGFGCGDALAVVQKQGIGKVGVDVGLGLVVVGGIRAVGAAAGAGAELLDAEQVHHALMVLF